MAKTPAVDVGQAIREWVREARISAGLSGEELGAKLALELGTTRGNSKGNISHWETGKHEPNLHQIAAISKVTKVPLPAHVITALGGADPGEAHSVATLAVHNMLPNAPPDLSEAAALLTMYAAVPKEARQSVLAILRTAYERELEAGIKAAGNDKR